MERLVLGVSVTLVTLVALTLVGVRQTSEAQPSSPAGPSFSLPKIKALTELPSSVREQMPNRSTKGRTLLLYLGDCGSCVASQITPDAFRDQQFDQTLVLMVGDPKKTGLDQKVFNERRKLIVVARRKELDLLNPQMPGQYWIFRDGFLVDSSGGVQP